MKALGTLLFHPHRRLKSFLWGLTRQMEADGVRGSPGQLMESGPESLARTKTQNKDSRWHFHNTTAELAFARFDLPIKVVIQNVKKKKYCFRGRRKTAIMANGNCMQKLLFDLATLPLFTPFIKSKSVLNPLNAVVNRYDPAWLEPAFHFNFGTSQQSTPPLLTKEWE